MGALYIAGDWNSRVGSREDYICNAVHTMYLDDDDYVPDNTLVWASVDKVCNNLWVKCVDLCKSTCFRLVNGRLHRACEGMFKFANSNGASVIDYLLTQENPFSLISDFSLCSFNEYSDHAGVYCSLKTSLHTHVEKTELKYEWNIKHRNTFRAGIISKLPEFNLLTNDLTAANNRDDVNDLLNSFTGLIRDVAGPMFAKECFYNEVLFQTNQ